MEEQEPASVTFSIRIAQPGRVLGILWICLGIGLFICFFLPNFTMAGMEINGAKLIDMVTRPDANVRRIFDDTGFFMMVAVPMTSLAVALAMMILGVLVVARGKGGMDLVGAIVGLGMGLFSIVGAIIIHHHHSEMLFISKLLPQPTGFYWLATSLQFLVSLTGLAHRLLVRRLASPA